MGKKIDVLGRVCGQLTVIDLIERSMVLVIGYVSVHVGR